MNFLGMGSLEVFVILLIAFVLLGPTKMVEAGRTLGRLVAQLRRMSAELPDMIDGEIDRRRPAATPSKREDGSAAVSPEMAIRLEKAFGSTVDAWLRLQAAYDLAQARRHERRIKVKRVVAA